MVLFLGNLFFLFWLRLECLRAFDEVLDVNFQNPSSLSRSRDFAGIQSVFLNESSHVGCHGCFRACTFRGLFFIIILGGLVVRRCFPGCCIGEWFVSGGYLQKEIADLADVILLVVNFAYYSGVGGSDFCELFIGGDICQFLKFFDGIALFYVEFLDGTFLDLFSQVGQVELDHSEGELAEWQSACEAEKGGLGVSAEEQHIYIVGVNQLAIKQESRWLSFSKNVQGRLVARV